MTFCPPFPIVDDSYEFTEDMIMIEWRGYVGYAVSHTNPDTLQEGDADK